jgi:hypothetical protein
MEFHLAALSNPQVFEGLDPDKYSENGKVRKLQSSSELISKIKSQLIAEESALLLLSRGSGSADGAQTFSATRAGRPTA